ncbi:hypothetical protein [Hymenobacter aerophilus]|uniref:hypothetical protein n=1 Tax=Hymenobacter aerophilus TaxID=119644 RepID=UPI0012F84EAA|nr:hypothetical protein [Hymenobacter aerophilus]
MVFTFFTYWAYKLAGYLRYKTTVRMWLIAFYAEIFVLFLLPKHIRLPSLPTLYKQGGYFYVLEFTADLDNLVPALLRGQKPEELLLLLLPLVPALLVLLYTMYTHRQMPSAPPTEPGTDSP